MSVPNIEYLQGSLHDLGDAALVLEVGTISDKGAVHPGLQDVPADVPSPSELRQANLDFAASVQAALDGGKKQGEERDRKRVHLLECVLMWSQFIVMRFKRRNDPTVLENNGFALKKPRAKKIFSRAPTSVPSDTRLKHGESTVLHIATKQISGNGTFELRFTTNPNDESSWIDGGHHTSCQMELRGLVPGTRYYISLRYHGKNGTSAWSDPVNIIAL